MMEKIKKISFFSDFEELIYYINFSNIFRLSSVNQKLSFPDVRLSKVKF